MASRSSAIVNASLPILFLGVSAAIQMIASSMYIKCRPDFPLIAQAFLVTAGVYLLNRILDKEDKFNNLTRWMFFNKTIARTLFWITIAGTAIFGPVLYNLALDKNGVAVWFAVLAITGLFYSVKIIPVLLIRDGVSWISIKDIPFLKSFIVCIAWGGSGLVLAAAANNVPILRSDILLIIITFCICTLNSTVTADARDTDGDKIRNILTIPVIFGEKGALKLLVTVNIITVILLAISGMLGLISGKLTIFVIGCIIWTGLSILPQYTTNIKMPKTVLELLVDSHVMTTAVGLGVLSLIQ